MLTSARWYTFELAARYRMEFADVYRQCVQLTGSPTVELAQRAFFSLLDRTPGPVDAVQNEFERRWSTILAVPPGVPRVRYRSAQLVERVAETFTTPRAGWSMARYHPGPADRGPRL